VYLPLNVMILKCVLTLTTLKAIDKFCTKCVAVSVILYMLCIHQGIGTERVSVVLTDWNNSWQAAGSDFSWFTTYSEIFCGFP
jgi:hypothetical protein